MEAHPQYVSLVRPIFRRIMDGRLTGIVSTMTLLEVLVQPLRLGAADMADRYRDLLTGSRQFETLPLTEAVAETAADLRARYRLRTADAVVAATALQGGCQGLVTNDERLLRVTELGIIFLDNTTL